MKYSIEPICYFVGTVYRPDKNTFKLGLFFYDFKYNQWDMVWEKKEFEYKRDCILSILPNKQEIPFTTTTPGFVNILKKRGIEEYVDAEKATTPSPL